MKKMKKDFESEIPCLNIFKCILYFLHDNSAYLDTVLKKNQLWFNQTDVHVCKKSILISNFNVCPLNTINQWTHRVSSANKLNINVICIQEHCYFHPEVKFKHRCWERLSFHLTLGLKKFHMCYHWWCWHVTQFTNL